jgi:hypothetical protein
VSNAERVCGSPELREALRGGPEVSEKTQAEERALEALIAWHAKNRAFTHGDHCEYCRLVTAADAVIAERAPKPRYYVANDVVGRLQVFERGVGMLALYEIADLLNAAEARGPGEGAEP